MQSRATIERDFRQQRELYQGTAMRPGRRKKLSAAQAATIFDLQVQIRAAHLTIHRILDEALVSQLPAARLRILLNNWRDRGRVDIQRPNKSRSNEQFLAQNSAASVAIIGASNRDRRA